MRAVIQRVKTARCVIDGRTHSEIGRGLAVLLGVRRGDSDEDAACLAGKIAHLRIFPDEKSQFQRSVLDAGGEALVISQFTLHADVAKGRRPSFDGAEKSGMANARYEEFVKRLRSEGVPVKTGVFGAMMDIELTNEGPVTLLCDSEKLK
ncbi:MAG: D-tyrosyl-tRNA(Tyr) deacylase [Nitrospirae bacterium]|nr:D-tyrosyl-tRNA(Tyr) deacylase [Nitrospirota bacterium]